MKEKHQIFRPCALVPVYNHGKTAPRVVERILSERIPVILIDDGSDEETRSILENLEKEFDSCTLFRLEKNQGKGGAVLEGLKEAELAGFSHAVQIDADGQHDLNQIKPFLELSGKNPEALICGFPMYDDSVPSIREGGRKITNFWVFIETWSRDIKDAMCGFRVYPLKKVAALKAKGLISRRMAFDIEILVRLHWAGTVFHFLPVQVVYPENGISHFRLFHDNVAISLAHSRLFFGMILRSPILLYRKIRSAFTKKGRPQ